MDCQVSRFFHKPVRDLDRDIATPILGKGVHDMAIRLSRETSLPASPSKRRPRLDVRKKVRATASTSSTAAVNSCDIGSST